MIKYINVYRCSQGEIWHGRAHNAPWKARGKSKLLYRLRVKLK